MTIEFAASAGAAERFFALTPERILDAVERVGRRSTGYALALGSLENRVYEVELDDEERVVAKFYRPGRWSPAAILEEHALLAELGEAEVPVAAPLPVEGGAGPLHTLGTLGEGEAAILFAVFPKLRGRPPDEGVRWRRRLFEIFVPNPARRP